MYPANAPSEPPYPRPLYAWYVVIVLLLASMLSFMDRQIISLLVIPIQHDLGIGDTAISLLQGFSFAIFYAIMGFPLARAVDAQSRRAIIAGGIFFWSLATAACGLARSFGQLFVARIGVGVGEATLLPGTASLLSDYFPPEKRGRALGLYTIGIFLGSGLALVIGGVLVKTFEGKELVLPLLGSIAAWQFVFILVGLPGIVVALLMFTVKELARRGVVRTPVAAGKRSNAGVPLPQVLAYMRANRRTLICHNLGFAAFAMVTYGGGAWIPTFLIRTHGWDAGKAGIVFGSLALVFGALGTLSGGWLADWLVARGYRDGRMRVGLVAAIGTGIPSVMFPFFDTVGAALVLLAPAIFFSNFSWAAAIAGIQDIMPNQMRGQAAALYGAVLTLIGLGLGPTSVALITDYVFHDQAALRYSLMIESGVCLTAAAVLFWASLEPYRASLNYLKHWSAANGQAAVSA